VRIAIATDDGQVSAHFGHCPQFILADIDNGAVVGQTVVDAPPHEPGLIPRFLKEHKADAVVAGGIGHKAVRLFESMGIEVVAGVTGSVEEVISGCADGTLEGGESLCSHDHSHG
jgi:predicted Fe-Mo cluster-binding NifX family protein